jgi:hypothetical protein
VTTTNSSVPTVRTGPSQSSGGGPMARSAWPAAMAAAISSARQAARLLLKGLELMGQAQLGDVQALGRAGEGALLHDPHRVLQLTQLSERRNRRVVTPPAAAAAASRIVMGVTMAFMLLIMV